MLHCFNFLQLLMFFYFIASQICLNRLKASTRKYINARKRLFIWAILKNMLIFPKQSLSYLSGCLALLYRDLARVHWVLTAMKRRSEAMKNASSLHFFRSVKRFIATIFYFAFNAPLRLLFKRESSLNASLPFLFKINSSLDPSSPYSSNNFARL